MQKLIRFLPVMFLVGLLIVAYQLGWHHYLSFQALQDNYQQLQGWKEQHTFISLLVFSFVYALAVAISIPGAVFLSLTGGFLFGIPLGTAVVVISATLGASLIFLAVRYALGASLANRTKGFVAKMAKGFHENAFSYLLVLRLIPVFPFWVVNIVPALLKVSFKTYLATTFLGIIPGALVFVSIGNGLGHLLNQGKQPDLNIFIDPYIIGPLFGLALLSVLPILYKTLRTSSHERDD